MRPGNIEAQIIEYKPSQAKNTDPYTHSKKVVIMKHKKITNQIIYTFLLLFISSTLFSLDGIVEDDIFTTLKGPVKSCLWLSKLEMNSSTASFLMIMIGNKAVYDREGQIIQRIHHEQYGNIANKIHHFYYLKEGKLEKEVLVHNTGEESTDYYFYDDQGRLIEKKMPDRSLIYKYFGKKIQKKFIVDEKVKYTYKTTLDNENRVIEERKFDDENYEFLKITYSYYDLNILKEKIKTSYESNTVTTIKFNKDGNITDVIFSEDGKVHRRLYYVYPEYDEYGNWTKRKIYQKQEGKKDGLRDVETRVIEYYESH